MPATIPPPCPPPFPPLQAGAFILGANYWASHAGTAMWTNWRPEVVDEDLRRLAEAGLSWLRVFPNWLDVQPIQTPRGGHARVKDGIFVGGEDAGDDPIRRLGVDPLMLERLREFCRIAERRGIRLVFGLITGWMSGRRFVPPALEHRNIFTDPVALHWQERYLRCLVSQLKAEPAIVAWDLGNECNCMDVAPNREAAASWTAFVANTIRATDATRPVVSGMHSLAPEPWNGDPWTIQDQGEQCDVLTTHPYPYWVRHANLDPVDRQRPQLHATAETRLYADLGGKPCFAEEIGTMGPMVAGYDQAADFLRASLWSLWADDCRGAFWWCAFDQVHLTHPPYSWCAVEQELGLWDGAGKPKPMLGELSGFARDVAAIRQTLEGRPLPPARREAVCLLTHGQDQWAAAYGAFILAKQAGFDLRFSFVDQPLPVAELYLVPSITGLGPVPPRRWHDLLERIRAGADALVTIGDGVLSPFTEPCGLRVAGRAPRLAPTALTWRDDLGEVRLVAKTGVDLVFSAAGAEVLASADDGRSMLSVNALGRGRLFTCPVPFEHQLATTPGAVDGPAAEPWWRLYRHVARRAAADRAATKASPTIALTEHVQDGDARFLVLVNHGPTTTEPVVLAAGWRLAGTLHGSAAGERGTVQVALPSHGAAVLRLVRTG